MTIKTLAGISVNEALAATMYESSSQLRERIRKISRKKLGEGAQLLKLQAILNNCKRLSEKRNDLIHGLWARELDGEAHVRDAYGGARPIPTQQELWQLANELELLTNQLNTERLEGFIKQAIEEKE